MGIGVGAKTCLTYRFYWQWNLESIYWFNIIKINPVRSFAPCHRQDVCPHNEDF